MCGELLIFDTNQQFATHRLKPLQEAIVRPIRESEAESK